MANNYKYFSSNDRVVTMNTLTQQVNLVAAAGANPWYSSSLDNSTVYFSKFGSGSNSYESSTKVFDLTFGRSSETTNQLTSMSASHQIQKNIYNQFGKVLLGYDSSIVKEFTLNGDTNNDPTKELHNAYYLNIQRGQFIDRIQEGSLNVKINVSGGIHINVVDKDDGKTYNGAAGTYSLLYATASSTTDTSSLNFGDGDKVCGLVFYEAGVAVISPYIFSQYAGTGNNPSGSNDFLNNNTNGILSLVAPTIYNGTGKIADLIVSGTIYDHSKVLRDRIKSIDFISNTEMNSTIYFCRAYNHEFNYSSNPTYLQNSKIVVKGDDPTALPRAYITSVGLYSEDNQLLAVAKLSEPILKTPENELIARVRLDW